MLERVAIYSKGSSPKTRDAVSGLVRDFCGLGVKMQIYQPSGDPVLCPGGELIERFSDLGSISGLPQLVISVGGDGTFLETAMKVKDLGIPVAGINTGRMGFLANISEDEIKKAAEMLCSGEYVVMARTMLDILKPAGLFEGNACSALNEVTIQKADLSMITVNVSVNGDHLNTYWCDGLIISTATGSTAYNLSAGGPILTPGDESIIISPLAPHNLNIRPILLSGNSRLRLAAEGRSKEFMVTCDFRSAKVSFSEEVEIQASPVKLQTVMLNDRDFYSTLRNKLMWGADRRN
ncbi:MAG: NAD(+)/NADH kinase [Bacteroidales bacterium]|nr:NAD(+)/NADH kinase [Bacteroidales bacterium]